VPIAVIGLETNISVKQMTIWRPGDRLQFNGKFRRCLFFFWNFYFAAIVARELQQEEVCEKQSA
jgi:hypothetical protein